MRGKEGYAMEVKWQIGETYETDRPADIEKGTDRVKVRRNIKRETRTVDSTRRKVWVYEYANMTLAQFDTYKRQLAELEQQKEREALKEQFGQLVALAAAQVTGKMLTEEDQRRINREAIDSLDS